MFLTGTAEPVDTEVHWDWTGLGLPLLDIRLGFLRSEDD